MTFDQLYDKYFSSLCWYAQRHGAGDWSEDVVNSAFFALYQKFDSSKHEIQVKDFLYKAVRFEVINTVRKEKLRHIKESEFQSQQEIIGVPSDYETYAEVLRIIKEHIDCLPKKNKTIFKLAYYEGLKIKDIAEKLRLPIQSVKNHLSRARNTLRISVLLVMNEEKFSHE